MSKSLFKEIESLIEKLEYFPYMETVKHHWCKISGDYHWVNHQGELYYSEAIQGSIDKEGCVLVNTDNGCGETVTMVFLKDMELSEDDFYDKYED